MPLVVLSGCSGGGKSTLVAELAKRGFTTVSEPGLRIVEEERAGDGAALPWKDAEAFAKKAVAMAKRDLSQWRESETTAPVYFDRSLVDAANALETACRRSVPSAWLGHECYSRTVFMAAPWPELFSRTADRHHDFAAAEQEYHSLLRAYERLDFAIEHLPKASVTQRADWLTARVGALMASGRL